LYDRLKETITDLTTSIKEDQQECGDWGEFSADGEKNDFG